MTKDQIYATLCREGWYAHEKGDSVIGALNDPPINRPILYRVNRLGFRRLRIRGRCYGRGSGSVNDNYFKGVIYYVSSYI